MRGESTMSMEQQRGRGNSAEERRNRMLIQDSTAVKLAVRSWRRLRSLTRPRNWP